MPGLDNFVKTMRELIQEELSKYNSIQPYVVTDVNEENYSVNVRHPVRTAEYSEVPVLGLGLGHLKGVMKLPKENDWVLVAFLANSPERPVVLGTLFDVFSQSPDTIPSVANDQLVLVSKEAGSFISLNPDNSILLNSVSSNGNPALGAKIKLYPDGSFKVFNRDGYGIECDASGNVTIRGVNITMTQTPGTL